MKIVLESLMHYYRGATREKTSAKIKERFGLAVPPRVSAFLCVKPYHLRRDGDGYGQANRVQDFGPGSR